MFEDKNNQARWRYHGYHMQHRAEERLNHEAQAVHSHLERAAGVLLRRHDGGELGSSLAWMGPTRTPAAIVCFDVYRRQHGRHLAPPPPASLTTTTASISTCLAFRDQARRRRRSAQPPPCDHQRRVRPRTALCVGGLPHPCLTGAHRAQNQSPRLGPEAHHVLRH
jgi:hypothetical protein